MNIHVKAHTKSKPYAALRAATHLQLVRDLKSEREAHFQAEMKKLDRALGRLVRFNVRRELA